jgi:GTPase Era involved in 16S rRNA processing
MSKAQEIQAIVAQRQPLAQKLGEIDTHLENLYNSIHQLEQQRQQQLTHWAEDSSTESKLQQLSFLNLRDRIQQGLASLHPLQKRFSRNTLNIGVIGRMGQGKSTLLQSLTGLEDEVIPSSSGKACTAARSTILHKEGSITTAEIEFHDKHSFLKEVIIPYYEKLHLTPKPPSFEAFAVRDLPDLPTNSDQTQINIYQRLKDDYHSNAKKYQEYLGKGSLTVQEQSQISNYVAQKYDEDYKLINHECLAVKKVKITCPFPSHEIGSIALVDVPGLGDFRLGDESLVIEALGQEVDFILFVLKPSKDRANFQQSDTELYNLANKALNNLSARSIFVLNADSNGENQENCRLSKADLDSKTIKIPVLDCVIADCSSPEEANSKVLQTVLDNLRENVTELDRSYTQEKIRDLEASLTTLKEQLKIAQEAFPTIDDDKIQEKYEDLFEDFWGKIANELTKLQDRLIANKDRPDENLKSQIDTVIEDCEQNVTLPSLESIEYRRNKLGSYDSTYAEYQRELRTDLSRRFLDIDIGLKKTIENTKLEIVKVLIEDCGLRGLSDAEGPEFLQTVTEQIPAEHKEIKKAFEILSEFNLSYRGLIQHRIRSKLETLTPDKTAKLKVGANGEDLLESLKELYQSTVYDCKISLSGFLSEPNQASFAIAEEFIDRVLRSETSEKEWRRFLRKNKAQIWGDFEKLQNQVNARQEWLQNLDSVKRKINHLEDALQKL